MDGYGEQKCRVRDHGCWPQSFPLGVGRWALDLTVAVQLASLPWRVSGGRFQSGPSTDTSIPLNSGRRPSLRTQSERASVIEQQSQARLSRC
jgi:hypothetical protein